MGPKERRLAGGLAAVATAGFLAACAYANVQRMVFPSLVFGVCAATLSLLMLYGLGGEGK